MMAEGSWNVWSKSDPRWDGSGRGVVGCFELPAEAAAYIEQVKAKLNEKPPADLTYSYHKD